MIALAPGLRRGALGLKRAGIASTPAYFAPLPAPRRVRSETVLCNEAGEKPTPPAPHRAADAILDQLKRMLDAAKASTDGPDDEQSPGLRVVV